MLSSSQQGGYMQDKFCLAKAVCRATAQLDTDMVAWHMVSRSTATSVVRQQSLPERMSNSQTKWHFGELPQRLPGSNLYQGDCQIHRQNGIPVSCCKGGQTDWLGGGTAALCLAGCQTDGQQSKDETFGCPGHCQADRTKAVKEGCLLKT